MLRVARLLAVPVLIGTSSVGFVGAPATAAARADCPSRPFVGTIERDADAATDQPAVALRSAEIVRGLAFDFGSARNTTVYLATYKLDPTELGQTMEAPPDEALVTVFLRPKSGDLDPGRRLRTPTDMITVIVDGGGGARATTSGAEATARVLAFDDEKVCFAIDYRDDHQHVKGRVRARVP